MAEADLAEVWAILAAEASEIIATRLLLAIESHFHALCDFPFLGPTREQFAPGLRVTFVNPYAIYYLPQETGVTIVRVLHGARDTAALAERGGFV